MAMTLFSHNFQPIELESCSNPPQEAESLRMFNFKKSGTFGFELFVGDVMSGWGSREFQMTLSGPEKKV